MKNKNKVILLASIIIGVLVVTLGLTYAAITFNETKGNSELVLGDIYMHYKETNQLILQDAMPMDINTYIVNSVMASQELNELTRCVNYFNTEGANEFLDVGSTLITYCQGSGTMEGFTFSDTIEYAPETEITKMLDLNIIVQSGDVYIPNPIMASQEVVDNELSRCIEIYTREYDFDEGSDAESFCKGTGTTWSGNTIQEDLDLLQEIAKLENIDFLKEVGQELLDSNIIIPQIENLPYFEFTIDGKNTYNKKDIWYEMILNHGDEHTTRTIRIRDDLLRFTLVEIEDGNNTVLFNDRKYNDLTNKKIYVDTIPANTNEEVNRTYRLYMWISQDTVIGNVNQDYTLEEWNDVFASVKVSVTGDFNEKIIATHASCFTTQPTKIYEHNINMTEEEFNICVNYLIDRVYFNPNYGDTIEGFCKGIDMNDHGYTLTDLVNGRDDGFLSLDETEVAYLEENNVINLVIEGLKIIDYDASCGADVVIPETINNQMLLKIGKGSFSEKELASVVFPNAIDVIDNGAFYGNQLTSITFAENSNLSVINGMSFQFNNLTIVNLPDTVTHLSCKAFDSGVTLNSSNTSCVRDYDE